LAKKAFGQNGYEPKCNLGYRSNKYFKKNKNRSRMNVEMKDRKKVLIINMLLFAALFCLISFNKEFLRPNLNNSEFLKILTGCFPNFIASYLISMAAVSAVLIRKLKHGRLIVYASSILVLVILTIEEIKPMWGASEIYDKYDIIASLVGASFAMISFEILNRIEKRKK
jgi:hypothetical protein